MKRFLGVVLAVSFGLRLGRLEPRGRKRRDGDPRQGHQGPGRRGETEQGQGVLGKDQRERSLSVVTTTNSQCRRSIEGLDHYRSEFEGKFGDNDVKGMTVLERRQRLAQVR